jgi:hypothetical protein
MKRFIMVFFCSILIHKSKAQVSLLSELKSYYDISTLPLYRTGTVEAQTSSYDRTGGNDDGFSGTYSYVRKNPDSSLVIFDQKGPGVVNRIWTATATRDTMDFYIDDNPQPTASISYLDLFSGKVFPFVAPLCNQQAGGYYSYFPILFQKHCMIVCRAKKTQFHQIQYRLFAEGTKVQSFSNRLDSKERKALEDIAALWIKSTKRQDDFYPGKTLAQLLTTSLQLQPNVIKTIFQLKQGGRITGFELEPASALSGVNSNLFLRITWDGEGRQAVDCPLSYFFGYAFGNPSMHSLLIGTDTAKAYSYFPMPFDQSATIDLINKEEGGPVNCKVKIYYSTRKRDADKEGKFYAAWKKDSLFQTDPYHVFLNITGKGHYVGTILKAEGLGTHGTPFFEGDDSTATDGVFRIHGTGSEDYFNGGWYDIQGRWDTARSMPLSGCLAYSHALARTGGYRLYLSDKIPFEKSIFQCIEHGRTALGDPAVYTSVSFYYSDQK